jgi:hypothetical protein
MIKNRKKYTPPNEFLVISDEGYFAGLYKGGKFRWSFELNEAKRLTNIEQFETIKRGYVGGTILQEHL